MKKIIITTLCLITIGFVVYFSISNVNNQKLESIDNNVDSQPLNTSETSNTEYINENVNSNDAVVSVENNGSIISSDEEIIENNTNNNSSSVNNAEKINNNSSKELDDKQSTDTKKEVVIESNTENIKENNDEFYDTSDRDPYAEEQHKADVPLVLIDSEGNEMQPETVYWDEESGRGTLDPNGYIPEGLPPGAVFVSEITPEEEARLREEFGVGD